ncbi:hypothetical protein [Psychroflexus tropicus]|uniref:hypothetical protein n=1 Tax=Psychroflexus tropicus TaxID=197345 RepID=UPI000379391C|nr:hypothetical protein [Psychroflexus tropicus]
MPANKKYLSSPGQRVLKISAGILGGYLLTMLFHNAIGIHLNYKGAIALTSAFSAFFMWVALMIFAFVSKNGWKIWGIYLALILVCGIIIYLGL